MTRNFTEAEYSQLVEHYKDFRKISRKLHNDVLPKYLPKRAFDVCGKKLGVLRNDTLVLASMDQTDGSRVEKVVDLRFPRWPGG